MTRLIEAQKIDKRKRQGSLLVSASVKRANQIPASAVLSPREQKPAARRLTRGIPRRLRKILEILTGRIRAWLRPEKKNIPVWTGAGAVLALAGLLAGFAMQGPRLDIVLPEDPILYSHLISYASVEFDGQGSGDILPAASAIIPAVNPVTYTVQPGDTISGIAKQYGLSERTLIGYNSITDVYRLIPGTELNIPDIDGIPYQVKAGDSISSIADKFGVEVNSILDANDLQNDTLQTGQNLFIPGARISDYEYRRATKTLLIYPTVGRLSSGYGYRADPFTGVRRFHYGIDLANSTGTSIVASMEGTVVNISDSSTGYGKSVIIRHANGFQTLYGHLDQILVRKNQWVNQGQLIGRMGNTGRSTGPHLHFSIYRNNVPVNPLTFLTK